MPRTPHSLHGVPGQADGLQSGQHKKKKRFEAIDLVIESQGKGNVMLLCAIADVSRKCYYDHRSRRDVADSDLIAIVE